MIIYDLHCSQGHVFEGWFPGRQEMEQEKNAGRLTCPMCGTSEIQLLPSGGHFSKSPRDSASAEAEGKSRPSFARKLTDYLEENFENVGPDFAETAFKIHFGEIDPKNIRGSVTPDEEKDLKEEGVEYLKVPIPKYQS